MARVHEIIWDNYRLTVREVEDVELSNTNIKVGENTKKSENSS